MTHETRRMLAWLRTGALIAMASLALAACASGNTRFGAPPTEVAVTAAATPTTAPARTAEPLDIRDFAFAPGTITVPVGTTLTWTNRDLVAHTVTAMTGEVDSGVLQHDAAFSWTFDAPGTFDYLCTIHPSMTGTVIVGA